MVATSRDLHAPRCTTFTGPGEVSSLVTDPPGTPVTPCFHKIYKIYRRAALEVLRLLRLSTHTHPALGRVESLPMR